MRVGLAHSGMLGHGMQGLGVLGLLRSRRDLPMVEGEIKFWMDHDSVCQHVPMHVFGHSIQLLGIQVRLCRYVEWQLIFSC